jgi:hypothetical protein
MNVNPDPQKTRWKPTKPLTTISGIRSFVIEMGALHCRLDKNNVSIAYSEGVLDVCESILAHTKRK